MYRNHLETVFVTRNDMCNVFFDHIVICIHVLNKNKLTFGEELSKNQPVNLHLTPFRTCLHNVRTKTMHP